LPPSLAPDVLAGTGVQVTWIPSPEPLTLAELARRVVPYTVACIVPHAYLGNLDLAAGISLSRAAEAPVRVFARGRAVDIANFSGKGRAAQTVETVGWLAELVDERFAHALVEAILAGQLKGVEVRGTAERPGVFRAHGAFVSPRASVIAPCYFGPDCYVGPEARVGPGAVIGEGAIVERGAKVIHARVGPNMIVGQGVCIERSSVLEGRVERHGDGRAVALDDPLLIGRAGSQPPELVAALAMPLLDASAALGAGQGARAAARRLRRVAERRGSWIGPRDAADPDSVVVDISSSLFPRGASEEEQLLARALYRRKKSIGRDLTCLAEKLRRYMFGGDPSSRT
jgi:hypothetical protein